MRDIISNDKEQIQQLEYKIESLEGKEEDYQQTISDLKTSLNMEEQKAVLNGASSDEFTKL